MKNKINIIHGDITNFTVDAIVNAANSSLLGGSGVDGVIHRVGGKKILDECQKIRARQGGCNIGDAVITTAGYLPAKYVIHTVGPRWNGGGNNEYVLLEKCYLSCFAIAMKYNVESLSFPNISTGIYKFPKKEAAMIAFKVITRALSSCVYIKKVNIVCFEEDNYIIYQGIVGSL